MDEVRRGRPRSGTLRFASLSEAQNSPLMPRASRAVQFAHSVTATIDDTLLTQSPRPSALLPAEADTYASSLTNVAATTTTNNNTNTMMMMTTNAANVRAEAEQACDIMWLPSVEYKCGPQTATTATMMMRRASQQHSAASILQNYTTTTNNNNTSNNSMTGGAAAPPPLLSLLPCDSAANSITELPRPTAESYWSSANVTPRSGAAFSPSEKAYSPARPCSIARHTPQSSPGRTFSQPRRFCFSAGRSEGLLTEAQKNTQAASDTTTLSPPFLPPPPPPPPFPLSDFVLDAHPTTNTTTTTTRSVCEAQRDHSEERAALSSTRAMPHTQASPLCSAMNEAAPLISLTQPSTLREAQGISHAATREVPGDGCPLPCTARATASAAEASSSLWGSLTTHCMKYISVGGSCQGWRRTMEDRQVLFPLYRGSHTGEEEAEFVTMTSNTTATTGAGRNAGPGSLAAARRMGSNGTAECATESSQAFLTLEGTEWGSVSCTSPPSQALPLHTMSTTTLHRGVQHTHTTTHPTDASSGTSNINSPVIYRDPSTRVAAHPTHTLCDDYVFCSPRGERVNTTTTTTTTTTTSTSAVASPLIQHTTGGGVTVTPHATTSNNTKGGSGERSCGSIEEADEEDEAAGRRTRAAIQRHIKTQEGSPLITRAALPPATTAFAAAAAAGGGGCGGGACSYSTSVATTRHESPFAQPPTRLSRRANTPPLPACSRTPSPMRHKIRGGFALLLDGHRGAQAAELAARHLPTQLLSALHTEHMHASDILTTTTAAAEGEEGVVAGDAPHLDGKGDRSTWWASELPTTSPLWQRRYADFVRCFVAVDQMLYDEMHGEAQGQAGGMNTNITVTAASSPPSPSQEPTGTTVTLAFADSHTLTVAQLGDSQAFLIERRPDECGTDKITGASEKPSSVTPRLASSPLLIRSAAAAAMTSGSSSCGSPIQSPVVLPPGLHIRRLTEEHRPAVSERERERLQRFFGAQAFQVSPAILAREANNLSGASPALRPAQSPMSRPMVDKTGCSPCASSMLSSPCGHLSPDYREAPRLSRRPSSAEGGTGHMRVRGRLGVSRALGDFDLKMDLHLPWPSSTQAAEEEEGRGKAGDTTNSEEGSANSTKEQKDNAAAAQACHAVQRAHLGWLVTPAELPAMGYDVPPCVTCDEPLLSPLLVSNVPQVRTYRRGQLPPLPLPQMPADRGSCCSYDALVLGCDGVWELQSIEPIARRIDDALQPLLRRQPAAACYCGASLRRRAVAAESHRTRSTSEEEEEEEEEETEQQAAVTRWIAEVEQALKEVVRTTLHAGIAPWCPAVSKGVPGLDNLSLSIILLLS